MFIYAFIINAVYESNAQLDIDSPSNYHPITEVYEYDEFQEFMDYAEIQMEEVQYSGWEVGEEGRSNRIRIGPVYHLTYKIEPPGRREIFEPGGFWSDTLKALNKIPIHP